MAKLVNRTSYNITLRVHFLDKILMRLYEQRQAI